MQLTFGIGYIQMELMPCCLGRKLKHLVPYWKKNPIPIFFAIQWIMTQSTIQEDILLVESVIWKNIATKL